MSKKSNAWKGIETDSHKKTYKALESMAMGYLSDSRVRHPKRSKMTLAAILKHARRSGRFTESQILKAQVLIRENNLGSLDLAPIKKLPKQKKGTILSLPVNIEKPDWEPRKRKVLEVFQDKLPHQLCDVMKLSGVSRYKTQRCVQFLVREKKIRRYYSIDFAPTAKVYILCQNDQSVKS